jgi:hypothetical protein
MRPVARPQAETPTGPTVKAGPTGARRDRKGSWTKPWPGVTPGIRGKFPAVYLTELNSTSAEEVKVAAASDGDSRKAC